MRQKAKGAIIKYIINLELMVFVEVSGVFKKRIQFEADGNCHWNQPVENGLRLQKNEILMRSIVLFSLFCGGLKYSCALFCPIDLISGH